MSPSPVLAEVMTFGSSTPPSPGRTPRRLLVLVAGAVVSLCAAQPAAGLAQPLPAAAASGSVETGQTSAAPVRASASATLEQCITAANEAERSATFGGEMTAISGSVRMEMRISVLERMPGEMLFRSVVAPGLGVWRAAAPTVKVYKFLKQVTNLSAPASYRGAVGFRWLNARGRPIKELELRTTRCVEPAAPAPATGTALPVSGA